MRYIKVRTIVDLSIDTRAFSASYLEDALKNAVKFGIRESLPGNLDDAEIEVSSTTVTEFTREVS
jgi:hypothetical protein